jgi:hypothetical protein
VLDTALSIHGETLEHLALLGSPRHPDLKSATLGKEEVEQIVRSCPKLRHLSATVRRTHGDGEELAIYRAIGSFPSLESVDLSLDVSEQVVEEVEEEDDEDDDSIEENTDDEENASNHEDKRREEQTDKNDIHIPQNQNQQDDGSFDQQPFNPTTRAFQGVLNHHIQEHLTNCAVDAELATSIFRAIASAKPAGSISLSRLTICVVGGGRLGQSETVYSLATVTAQLGRSWLVTLYPGIDRTRTGEILVKELQGSQKWPGVMKTTNRLPRDVATIFRRIWSESEEGEGDWRKEWRSLPLATTTTALP